MGPDPKWTNPNDVISDEMIKGCILQIDGNKAIGIDGADPKVFQEVIKAVEDNDQ